MFIITSSLVLFISYMFSLLYLTGSCCIKYKWFVWSRQGLENNHWILMIFDDQWHFKMGCDSIHFDRLGKAILWYRMKIEYFYNDDWWWLNTIDVICHNKKSNSQNPSCDFVPVSRTDDSFVLDFHCTRHE